MIRLSVFKGLLIAPNEKGDYLLRPYTPSRGRGLLGDLNPPVLADQQSNTFQYLQQQIAAKADPAALADQPVVVMVHGFQFDPRDVIGPDLSQEDNPHGRIYHFNTRQPVDYQQEHHTTSWPVGLGFDRADNTGASGLALALGWYSVPHFSLTSYKKAYQHANSTAWVLFNILNLLHPAGLPADKPIDIFCHSLGSRVVVQALRFAAHVQPQLLERLGHVLILGGAERLDEVRNLEHEVGARLQENPHLKVPTVFNMVGNTDYILSDVARLFSGDLKEVIGYDGVPNDPASPYWMNLELENPLLQHWMSQRNFDIASDNPASNLDHWYYFSHPGNMAVYRDMLRNRHAWRLGRLRQDGIPERLT